MCGPDDWAGGDGLRGEGEEVREDLDFRGFFDFLSHVVFAVASGAVVDAL